MTLSPKRLFFLTFATGLVLEIFSYAGFFYPKVELVVISILLIGVLLLTLQDIRYGLWCVLAELVIGSQGYLLSLQLGSFVMSLRMALWMIVMAVWLAREGLQWLRHKNFTERYKEISYSPPLMFLAAVMILGLAVGFLSGNDRGLYILEGKRWLYSVIIISFILTFKTKEDIKQLVAIITGGVAVLCLQALALIYVFSHALAPFVYDVYSWMRGALLGEITRLPSGFSRVFMQSQIFVLPVLIGGMVYGYEAFRARSHKLWWYGSLAVAALVTVVASLSRSFWVALAVSGGITAVIFYCLHRPKVREILRFVVYGMAVAVVSFLVLWIVVRFPYPRSQASLDVSLLSDRATKMEAGAASRWALWPVMWHDIIRSPLWGYGFGKTLTYQTSDPRIVSSTVNGEFTTYAFEWGWLDLWLKFGLLGVLAYLWLLWELLRDGVAVMKVKILPGVIVVTGVMMIAVVHFFTPYLNHPLGFGYLAVLAVATAWYREACRFPRSIV